MIAVFWRGLRDPRSRPATTLAISLALAVAVALGAPALRFLVNAAIAAGRAS